MDLDERPLHDRADVRLSEQRTRSLHPQHDLQHPQPLLQEVGRVGLQVANMLPGHDLHREHSAWVLPFLYQVLTGQAPTIVKNQIPGELASLLHGRCCWFH